MAKENLCEEYRKLTLECEELRNQIKKEKSELARIESIIRNHSTFKIDLIGEAFADLITAISGRKFVYDKVQHHYYRKHYCDDYYEYISSTVHIIVAQEKFKQGYYDTRCKGLNSVEELVKNGDAVRLVGPGYYDEDFTLYPYAEVIPLEFDNETFDYIEPFMQALIQYRCEKHVATKKNINACLKKFLEDYKRDHTTKNPASEKNKSRKPIMAKENIFEEYRKLTLELEELTKQINEKVYGCNRIFEILYKHSTFKIDLIGEALADLITAISGRKFVYDKVQRIYWYKQYREGLYSYGYDYASIRSTANIVVAQEKYKQEYHDVTHDARFKVPNSVEELAKNGDAVRLPDPDYSQDFAVYPYDKERHLEFDNKTFDYIEPFMHALIQYCCENHITYATKNDISKFLENYKKEHTTKNPTKTLGKKTQ